MYIPEEWDRIKRSNVNTPKSNNRQQKNNTTKRKITSIVNTRKENKKRRTENENHDEQETSNNELELYSGQNEQPDTEQNKESYTDTEENVNVKFDNIYDTILNCITRNVQVVANDENIELDTILSRVPYHEMLCDLFGNSENKIPENMKVPIVCKAYEESFLRECNNANEKPCVMGSNCECMFINSNMEFVGTEFILPGCMSEEQAQMCVLCHRKTTQQLFHDMVFKCVPIRGVIQRYGNICGQVNEYARECMLICPPNQNVHCMPLPIVSHQRNRYSVYISNGIKHLKQHRVAFEDFQ
jgi:hypothetical protein